MTEQQFVSYRKRPEIVLALRYDGRLDELPFEIRARSEVRRVWEPTTGLEGYFVDAMYIAIRGDHKRCYKGDWIIKDFDGGLRVSSPIIFERLYDEVTD